MLAGPQLSKLVRLLARWLGTNCQYHFIEGRATDWVRQTQIHQSFFLDYYIRFGIEWLIRVLVLLCWAYLWKLEAYARARVCVEV